MTLVCLDTFLANGIIEREADVREAIGGISEGEPSGVNHLDRLQLRVLHPQQIDAVWRAFEIATRKEGIGVYGVRCTV